MCVLSDVFQKLSKELSYEVQKELSRFFTSQGKKVIVLAGPTGVGKTSLSLKLATMLGGEIVSSDSMQVFRGMDIGTAKVSLADRQKVFHYLVDIKDLSDSFSVYDFFQEAKSAIDSILARNRVPIVVGGTGFYIHTLLYGPPSGPPSDPHVRSLLEKEEELLGIEPLFERLKTIDPDYAATVTAHDRHKIIRALEIIDLSGKKVSDFSWKTRPMLPSFDFRCWFLTLPRKMLYEKLEKRCMGMLNEGFLEEVVRLDKEGLRKNRTASQSVGYREALEYLDTAKTPEDYKLFVERFKQASRHLAKRQFTWFRKEKAFQWLDLSTMSEEKVLEMIADEYLKPPYVA